MVETTAMLSPPELFALPGIKDLFGDDIKIEEIFPVKKHLLTHQRLFVRFIKLQQQSIEFKEQWFTTDRNNLKKLALPKVIFIFLKNIFNL